jgi:hypothetical protein
MLGLLSLLNWILGLQLLTQLLIGILAEVLGPTSTYCFFLHCSNFLKLNFLIQISNMSSAREVVLGVVAKKYKKKKKTGSNAKKRLHIFFNDTKKAFLGWKDVLKLWVFSTCEAYIEWCHIFRKFPHYHPKLYHIAYKANLHQCKWSIFKERCIEMCKNIYTTTFLENNECSLSIAKMVYAKVVLGKAVD